MRAPKTPPTHRVPRSAPAQVAEDPPARTLLSEWPATPWDEPELDWGPGPRRHDPLWRVRKAFNRELRLGTW